MSERDPIFLKLPPHRLREIASCLDFDVLVGNNLYCQLSEGEQLCWLESHRHELEDHLSWVGSHLFGKSRSYLEILRATAAKIGATHARNAGTAMVEQAIVFRAWQNAVEKMTDQQRAELRAKFEELAAKQGKRIGKELSGLTVLGAAQLSGFGVYLLCSTLLGAVNTTLGLGLAFGAFTGLSSAISVMIGPVGWVALGLSAIIKLGGPNYKKIIPAIFVIATARAEAVAQRNILRIQMVSIVWMTAEVAVSLWAAWEARSPALAAFCGDSILALLSASVVFYRFTIRGNQEGAEGSAAIISGILLFALAAFVTAISIITLAGRYEPRPSSLGIVVLIAAATFIPWLASKKRDLAIVTGSAALKADAAESALCGYLSLIALVGLVLNAIWHISWADPVAALFFLPFIVREGWEAVRGERASS
jgi:uncharacterized protein YaaW (UPF0174 family)